MSNADLVAALETLARYMELLGVDSFRVIAHTKVARAIEGMTTDLVTVAKGPQGHRQLTEIPGIGPKIADKLVEIATTGRLAELDELAAQVPVGLIPLLQLQGVGPKSVHVWWKEAGVTDLASLRAAIDSGKLAQLPRHSAKTVEKIKTAIDLLAQGQGRMRLGEARDLADRVIAQLRTRKEVTQIEAAGSMRRGRDTAGDIDILVTTTDPAATVKAFTTLPLVKTVLLAGETRASVRMAATFGSRWDRAEKSDDEHAPDSTAGPTVQVDLRVLADEHFGAALQYFTGSKDHNVRLRQRALDMGLTVNDYGVYPLDKSTETPPHKRGATPIASRTEQDVYKALGLPYIPPELREDRGEFDLTKTPRLIEDTDIKAELHAHTTASDGALSIVQLATLAKDRGYHTIAVTDHSQSQFQARGLKPDRLREHVKAIHAARTEVKGITILAGSEVDILADGTLDYDDDLLAELDVVVASPHNNLTQGPADATKRLIKAAAHPLVHIIAHPTGRLILRRKGLEPDMNEVIAAAKEHDTALEINAHWMRLDLRDVHVRAAVEAGCRIAINCDVHSAVDFENIRFGVATARRGWLTPDLCLNAMTAKTLHAWLKR